MRKPSDNPDFTKLRGPSNEDLQAIEANILPTDIPQVPTGAIVGMCTELIPETPHHVGADNWASRPDGFKIA